MKKLIMFVMVLMLCMGTSAKAGAVAAYDFNGTFTDCSGNGYDGSVYDGEPGFSSDAPSAGSTGGQSLSLNGASSLLVAIPPETFEAGNAFTIMAWFKTSVSAGGCIVTCGPPGDLGDDNHMATFINPGEEGEPEDVITLDYFWSNGASTVTTGLNDDAWHHWAIAYDGTQGFTIYLDGDVDATPEGSGWELNTDGAVCLIGFTVNTAFPGDLGNAHWDGLLKDVAVYDEALGESDVEAAMDGSGFPTCTGPKNPIIVDANDVTVYEPVVQFPFDIYGNFTISLSIAPEQGSQITARVDPNGGPGGGNPDLTLLGSTLGPGDDAFDNRVWLTFTPTTATDTNDIDLARESCTDWNPANPTYGCWNTPLTVRFKAEDDAIPEPEGEGLNDPHEILVKTFYLPHPTDANYANERTANVTVKDNDKADILFTITPKELNNPKNPVTGPVQIWEEQRKQVVGQYVFYYDQWRKIGVTLQLPPSGDPVKLQGVFEGEIEGDNFPKTDPCLPYEEIGEPNGMIFTAANYNVSQPIKIWGNDDALLQAEEAEAEGDEDYRVELIVSVIDDGGDSRYTDLERIVALDIEDNECGAFGYLDLDISNPYYVTDPNYASDDPDCYVDIYDAIEMATRWLECSDPQTAGCEQYNL